MLLVTLFSERVQVSLNTLRMIFGFYQNCLEAPHSRKSIVRWEDILEFFELRSCVVTFNRISNDVDNFLN